MNTFKRWALHYVDGLVAQSFNGAISSVVAVISVDVTGTLKDGITFAFCWHTFAIALGIHGLLYFRSNPLPTDLPADKTAPPFPIVPAQTATPPAPPPTNPPTP